MFLFQQMFTKRTSSDSLASMEKRLKSLYYCRSKSIQRAENINAGSSTDVTKNVYSNKKESSNEEDKYEECLSCQ